MNKRSVIALVGVSGLMALCALTGCSPKPADDTTTVPPATAPSMAAPGAMASPATAPAPPGPKAK